MEPVKVAPILREVAESAGYSVADILAHKKCKRLSYVRQFAMWRARKETGRSYPEIARVFGRDHSSVVDAFRKFEAMAPESRGDFPNPRRRGNPFKPAETIEGKPCSRGHRTRYVSNGRCVACKRAQDIQYSLRDKELRYAKTPEARQIAAGNHFACSEA